MNSSPNGEAKWKQLEAQAADLTRAAEFEAGEPIRVSNTSNTSESADHRLELAAGHCYFFGAAWSYDGAATLYVTFPEKDGQRVNDQMAGRRFRLPEAQPIVCADHDGEVVLSFSGITTAGVMAYRDLLEYAVVIGTRSESEEEAAVRQDKNRADVTAEKKRQAANVAAAEERERRHLAERCLQCKDEYRACQVDRHNKRAKPPPGVSVQTNCEVEFQRCSQGEKYGVARAGEWPCGRPN